MKTVLFFCNAINVIFGVSVTTITNGQVTTGSWTSTNDEYQIYRDVTHYQIFIPSNVLVVNVTSVKTRYFLSLFLSSTPTFFSGCHPPAVHVSGGRGLPCGIATNDDAGGITPCANYFGMAPDVSASESVLIGPDDNNALPGTTVISDFQVDTWWYVSFGNNFVNLDQECSGAFIISVSYFEFYE